jgi:hypothetical protein
VGRGARAPLVPAGELSSRDSREAIRLLAVLPAVLDTMGIDYDEDDLDGEAVRLGSRRGHGHHR